MDVNMSDNIHRVYAAMVRARLKLHDSTEAALTARLNYETEKADRLAAGAIVGKNETEREAAARAQMPELYMAMMALERLEREAKRNFDIALLTVEMTRALLRLAEVEAKVAE
jgi:hypothetical protein